MPSTNGDPYFHPLNDQSLVVICLEQRRDFILHIIAESQSGVPDEIFKELADIFIELESE